jgi:Mrp family chromosome partitioning ATPase
MTPLDQTPTEAIPGAIPGVATESPPAPRLISLAAAIQQRQAMERPEPDPDPHDLFGIFQPYEETATESTSELAAAILPWPHGNTSFDTADVRPEPPERESSDDASDDVPACVPIQKPFRPMLQVARFPRPNICRQLDETAGDEMERLAEALAVEAERNGKVFGMAGCSSGEGATTLLLTVAARLSRRLKVAVVDAHLTCPDLARRLGLQPEDGWEDVLSGRLPLAEVVIESVENQMALLPTCKSIPRADLAAEAEGDSLSDTENQMLDSIDILADSYDLVLVDLGPLDDLTPLGGVLASRLDAIVLVQNHRTTSDEQLSDTLRQLSAVQIPQVGVVQNFVGSA